MKRAVYLLLIAVAVVLRIGALGRDGLWVDEAYTAEIAQAPSPELLDRLRNDEAPPLFYFAEKAMLATVGDSETAVRFLPALFGIGFVLAATAFARRFRPDATLAVLAVTAAHTLLIFYSRQARSYSLLHLLSIGLLASVLALRERPSRGAGLGFLLSGLALLYTHNLALWTVGAGVLGLALGFPRFDAKGRRVVLLTVGLLALGSIPWLVSLAHQLGRHQELNAWMASWWRERSIWLAPFYSALVFTNGTSVSLHPPTALLGLERPLAPVAWLLWPFAFGAVGFAIREVWTARRAAPGSVERTRGDGLVVIALFFALPLLALLATSLLLGPAYVLGRTDTLALPAFLLLVAFGGLRIPGRGLAPVGFALWIVVGLAAAAPVLDGRGSAVKGHDRELARLLGASILRTDAIVTPELGLPTLRYYAKRQGWRDRVGFLGSFPPLVEENPAGVFPATLDSVGAWSADAAELRQRLEARGIGRVFVLAVREPEAQPARRRQHGPAWPGFPAAPAAVRRQMDANMLHYPMSLFVHALVGLERVPVKYEYLQDWVGGDRVVLEIPRLRFVDPDSLPKIEVQR